MAQDLTTTEIETLEALAGRRVATWGAAFGAALEALRGRGLVRRDGALTEQGARYLAGREKPKP